MATLSERVGAFCAILRAEHGFTLGGAEVRDALRALETVGPADRARVRAALRLVCCGTREQRVAFDRAFDDFFANEPPGIAQPDYRPRHTRPGREDAPARGTEVPARAGERSEEDGGEGTGGPDSERRALDDDDKDARSALFLRARYSPAAARGSAPDVPREPDAAMLVAAARLIASARLGRSRRWRASARASAARFDLRRTARASLRTGGDLVDLRFRDHPPRNPRFALLIDGSRSMSEHTDAIVAFARALCARTRRCDVFFFSTALRDVTRAFREREPEGAILPDLGPAWGGGTKIGTSLANFVDEHGMRALTRDTIAIVFSDGLDVGNVRELERAMRELERRSAGVIWLNPHAASPGFAPAARGMRAALPFVSILGAAPDAASFERLAQRVATEPTFRGRRR